MGRSLVDGERSESVRRRVYLPDVDEFRSSSGPLSEVVLDSLDPVSSPRAKPLKEGYVADITREGGVSPSCVILGLLYIHRLTETNPRFLRTMSSKDLFLTAMVIASKYLNDEGESEALTNSEWAEVGCKSKPALDLLERQFLAAIALVLDSGSVFGRLEQVLHHTFLLDWRLYVSVDEYYSFVTGIEGRIALNQFASRGWLSYTDLVTIWDTMDTQTALLTASKQVAKVTCGSAAVYLVLLSTLFTASHSLNSSWPSSSPSSPSSPSPTAFPLSSPPSPTTANSTSTDNMASLMMIQNPPNIAPPELPLGTYDKPPPPGLDHVLHGVHLEHNRLKLHSFRAPQMLCAATLLSPTPHPSAARCVHHHSKRAPDLAYDPIPYPSSRCLSRRACGGEPSGLMSYQYLNTRDSCSGFNTSTSQCSRCGCEAVLPAGEKLTFPSLRGVDSDRTYGKWLGSSGGEERATHNLLQPPPLLGFHHHNSEHAGVKLHDNFESTGMKLTHNGTETLMSTIYQYLGELKEWGANTLLQVALPHGPTHNSNFSLKSPTTSPQLLARAKDNRRLQDILLQSRPRSQGLSFREQVVGVDQQLLLSHQGRLWL